MVEARPRLSFTSRLFAWSLVLDPLLFFVFADRGQFGITIALGRALQTAVLILLALKLPVLLLSRGGPQVRVKFPPPFLWKNYAIYVALAVLAGIVGLWSGAYAVPTLLEFNANESKLAQAVNSTDFRPLVEYVIVVFNFLYFVMLTPIILNSREHLEYFFTAFRRMLWWCLFLGFADVIAVYFFQFEHLPRYLSDRVFVGPRFHGLAGEPRHAFAYLLFALGVLYAQAHFTGTRVSRRLIAIIAVAAGLTQSGSGAVAIGCFVALYTLEAIWEFRFRVFLRLGGLFVGVILVIYAASLVSVRVGGYLDSSRTLWAALEQRQELPGNLQYQKSEIYPLYDMIKSVQRWRFWPGLMGSGLGSASAVNNRLAVGGIVGLENPNSQIVRTLYESGLLGSLFFVAAFVVPIRHWTAALSRGHQRGMIAMMLLVLGGVLGVRGTEAYIYLGLLAAIFSIAPRQDAGEAL